MNEQLKKLEEEQRRLALRQEELADQLAKLRNPPEQKRGPGSVWERNGELYLESNDDDRANVELVGTDPGRIGSLSRDALYSPRLRHTCLGPFNDVFITKKRVREILMLADQDGYCFWHRELYTDLGSHQQARAFRAEGITQIQEDE